MTTSKHYPKILTGLAILSTMLPMRVQANPGRDPFGMGHAVEPDIFNWHMSQMPPIKDFERMNPGKWEPLCENIRTNLPAVTAIPLYAYHLTTNQWETLLPALKENHTIQYLDMEYTGLQGDYADRLIDAVEGNPNLKGLSLANNALSAQNIKRIGSFLAENKSLQSLMLGNDWWRIVYDSQDVSLEEIKPLTDALRKNNTLRVLDLDGLKMTPDAMAELFDALKENKSIQELALKRTGSDKKVFADLFADYLASNPNLQAVDIWANELGPGSGAKIAKALEKNTHLKELWACHNSFNKKDYYALAEMLPKNKVLTRIHWDGEADESVGAALAKGMLNNSSVTDPGFIDYQKMNQRDIVNIKQAARFNQDHQGQDVTLKQWRETHTPNPRVIQDWERNPL